MNARYLLRFDDICPMMDWTLWPRIEAGLLQANARPILAVIPDNRDRRLFRGSPVSNFWDKVREWSSWGWTIGMHGYRHELRPGPRGLAGRLPRTEFAGLTFHDQKEKIERSLMIFERERVVPAVWVAPANSFDDITIAALRSVGMSVISDGMTLLPYEDDRGLLWIPQQMGRPWRAPWGVWTFALHHNTWEPDGASSFLRRLTRLKDRLSDVETIAREFAGRKAPSWDRQVERTMRVVARLKGSLMDQVSK